MNKKNYVINAKKGPILRNALNDFFNQSQSYDIELIKIDHSTGDYEGKFKGKIKSMNYSKSFEETVLEFIKRQEEFNKQQIEFNKQVITRLDNIETRLDKIEQCPTIQKEIII